MRQLPGDLVFIESDFINEHGAVLSKGLLAGKADADKPVVFDIRVCQNQ